MFLLIHHSSLTSIHVIAEISFLSNRIQDRPRVSEVLKFRLVLTQLNCVLILRSSCEDRIAGKKTIALAHHCAQKGLGFETCNWAKLNTPASLTQARNSKTQPGLIRNPSFSPFRRSSARTSGEGCSEARDRCPRRCCPSGGSECASECFPETQQKKTLMKHAWFTQLSGWEVFSLRSCFLGQPRVCF